MRWSGLRVIPLAALVSAVAGCGLFGKDVPSPCPRANILSDAASIVKYREGSGRDLTDVEFEGEITALSAKCEYVKDNSVIDMSVTVTIDVSRGQALASSEERKVIYFVSIVDRLNQQILNKAQFEVPFKFPSGRNRLSTGGNEQISERINLRPGRNGIDYEVLVGFQLSEEQLRLNRRQR